MKGVVLGVVGVGGIGTFAVVGGGGPNDYIGVTSRSPAAVYAAFSELGHEGQVSIPVQEGGWGSRVTQRIVKVPNEQVKLELAIDDEVLVSAEVQLEPEGEGTKVAAELELNQRLMTRLMKEAGAPPMPTFAFQDFLIDQVFAQAMSEMMTRIEEGKPLLSLAETHARWGSDDRDGPRRASGTWQQHQAARPEMSARPMMNPNAERLRPNGY